MNMINGLFSRKKHEDEKTKGIQPLMVSYEANISYASDFLVHFYDAENMPILLEKSGTYFQILQEMPLARAFAYFRVHVFNPRNLDHQTLKIAITSNKKLLAKQIYRIPQFQPNLQWHSLKASLL